MPRQRIIPTYESDPKRIIFPDEPIQWHLTRSTHDRCPKCGSPLGYLSRSSRACLGRGSQVAPCDPSTVWECQLTPRAFFMEMVNRGVPAERIGWKHPGGAEPLPPPSIATGLNPQGALFPSTEPPSLDVVSTALYLGESEDRVRDLMRRGKLARVAEIIPGSQKRALRVRLTMTSIEAYKHARDAKRATGSR